MITSINSGFKKKVTKVIAWKIKVSRELIATKVL